MLAALAPVATLPAVAGLVIAATVTSRLTVLLAFPVVTLVAWQMPPLSRIRHSAAPQPISVFDRQGALCLRVLSLNVQAGSVDPAIVLRNLERYKVNVLALQELSQETVHRLANAGVTHLLPFCHLDPRPGSAGTGLWARWPLVPLSPVPDLIAAAPRARIDLPDGRTLTLTVVHPIAPVSGQDRRWEEELLLIRSTLAETDGPQVVAGDFNASRDHRPFRDLLLLGFWTAPTSPRSARGQALPGRSAMRSRRSCGWTTCWCRVPELPCASRGSFECPAPITVVCSPSWSCSEPASSASRRCNPARRRSSRYTGFGGDQRGHSQSAQSVPCR
jgi:endonuclease/exonuclease/phosphatase (EEP) superfamily protein YafD